MATQKLKQSLSDSISSIVGNGSFFSYGKAKYVIPKLKVGSEIEVSLPLQRDTAKKLISYAVQAPYGKGNDTIVNTKVRKTWEIDASKITFGNPAWKKLLSNIVNKVKEDFSINDIVVEPHLYKLLIYEKGGFFLKHKDTEKQNGMFASLIINLPSEFTGGELEVEWNGKSKKIDFSSHIYDIGFAAFYTDCDHEVHPIKSGYRISLAYNLVKIDNETEFGLSTLSDEVDEIGKILEQISETKIEKPLLYLLDHQYTPTNFALKKLKDNDINRTEALLQAAKKAGFFVDLGLFTHHIDGLSDDYGNYDGYGRNNYSDNNDDESVTMTEIIDEYVEIGDWLGTIYPTIKELRLDEVEILNNRDYKKLEEAISSYAEGYMGNYGPTVEYDYHLGAVILFPFRSMGNFIENASKPILLGWIDYFLNNETKNVDYADLIVKFLSVESTNDHWDKGELDPLVDCFVHSVVEINNTDLIKYLGKYFHGLSSKKAVTLVGLLDSKALRSLLLSALDNENIANLLAVLKLFLKLEIKATETSPNILTAHSEFIFNSVTVIFKAVKDYPCEEDKIISKTLLTLLKISNHSSINKHLELKFSKYVDRRFIRKFLAPIVIKSQKGRNDLWQLYYGIVVAKLNFYTESKPLKPADWTRDFNYNGKMDPHLEVLKSFLLDGKKETYIYAKAQRIRSYTENLIIQLNLDISYITIKKGSPHQLHLTKNENSFHKKVEEYEEDILMLEVFKGLNNDGKN